MVFIHLFIYDNCPAYKVTCSALMSESMVERERRKENKRERKKRSGRRRKERGEN